MPFRPGPKLPDYESLRSTLVAAREQIENYPLYQTIIHLLDANTKAQNIFKEEIDDLEDLIAAIQALDFLTHADNSVSLPNSRNLVAGSGITFDDTVDNVRTISSTGGEIPMAVGDGTGMMIGDHWLLIAH